MSLAMPAVVVGEQPFSLQLGDAAPWIGDGTFEEAIMSVKHVKEDGQRRAALGRMLREKQLELGDKLRKLRSTLPVERAEVRDAEEQRMDEFVRDMDFALLEMESATLQRIDEALLRLEKGTYGVCASCGEPVAEARLRAVPFANLCRACQEEEEEREGRPGVTRVAFDGDAEAIARPL
jgi:RNA polymerase-binding transcription factor